MQVSRKAARQEKADIARCSPIGDCLLLLGRSSRQNVVVDHISCARRCAERIGCEFLPSEGYALSRTPPPSRNWDDGKFETRRLTQHLLLGQKRIEWIGTLAAFCGTSESPRLKDAPNRKLSAGSCFLRIRRPRRGNHRCKQKLKSDSSRCRKRPNFSPFPPPLCTAGCISAGFRL